MLQRHLVSVTLVTMPLLHAPPRPASLAPPKEVLHAQVMVSVSGLRPVYVSLDGRVAAVRLHPVVAKQQKRVHAPTTANVLLQKLAAVTKAGWGPSVQSLFVSHPVGRAAAASHLVTAAVLKATEVTTAACHSVTARPQQRAHALRMVRVRSLASAHVLGSGLVRTVKFHGVGESVVMTLVVGHMAPVASQTFASVMRAG